MRYDRSSTLPFESKEVTELVGIQLSYLNKFVTHDLYKIKPSAKSGDGRGKRRWFTADDVFGIALVWWLFEGGLRSATIQYVLNQICGGRLKSSARDAAAVLLAEKAEMLVVQREPRTANEELNYPKQRVYLEDVTGTTGRIEQGGTASTLVIPVGKLFSNLTKSMESRGPQ